MANIKVSLEEVVREGERVISNANELISLYNALVQTTENLTMIWSGQSAADFATTLINVTPVFSGAINSIGEMGLNLKKAASNYSKADGSEIPYNDNWSDHPAVDLYTESAFKNDGRITVDSDIIRDAASTYGTKAASISTVIGELQRSKEMIAQIWEGSAADAYCSVFAQAIGVVNNVMNATANMSGVLKQDAANMDAAEAANSVADGI